MTGEEYQLRAARTINPLLSFEEMEHHAVFEINSEAGEIAGIYQKELQGHEFNEEHLKKEIGDLLWGIAELCTARGFTMDEVMAMNIEKLEQRYPNGFAAERSLNRAKGDV